MGADTPPELKSSLQTRRNELIERENLPRFQWQGRHGESVTTSYLSPKRAIYPSTLNQVTLEYVERAAYQSGEAIKSPSPRQYMELPAHIASRTGADAASTLRSIAVNTSRSTVADSAGGQKVCPPELRPWAPLRNFFSTSYGLIFTATDQGFDEISLRSHGGY